MLSPAGLREAALLPHHPICQHLGRVDGYH
jgi:hypothetical protein